MILVENEIILPASRETAWHVLTDLGSYERWHPSLALDGVAKKGQKIGLTLTNTVLGRDTPRVNAAITQMEVERVLEWQFGIPFLFQLTETYVLNKDPAGCKLTHRMHYSGLAARYSRERATIRSHAMLCKADNALREHLARRSVRRRPTMGHGSSDRR